MQQHVLWIWPGKAERRVMLLHVLELWLGEVLGAHAVGDDWVDGILSQGGDAL